MRPRLLRTLMAFVAALTLFVSAARLTSPRSVATIGAEARPAPRVEQCHRPQKGDGEVLPPVGPATLLASRRGPGGTWSPRVPQPPTSSSATHHRCGAGGHVQALRPHAPFHVYGFGQRVENAPFACHPASDYYVYALRRIIR